MWFNLIILLFKYNNINKINVNKKILAKCCGTIKKLVNKIKNINRKLIICEILLFIFIFNKLKYTKLGIIIDDKTGTKILSIIFS